MLKQSIEVNSIILGAAGMLRELEELPGDQAMVAKVVAYDLVRSIGLPLNGLRMIFGGLVSETEPIGQADAAPLKCQLCEDPAENVVRTTGGHNLVVCHRCASGLELHGAQVVL